MKYKLMHYLSSVYFVNQPRYDPIKDAMTLLKYIEKPSLLIPYEQLCIQSYQQNNQLIPEQHSYEKENISINRQPRRHVTT
jgi:hypothetical protein